VDHARPVLQQPQQRDCREEHRNHLDHPHHPCWQPACHPACLQLVTRHATVGLTRTARNADRACLHSALLSQPQHHALQPLKLQPSLDVISSSLAETRFGQRAISTALPRERPWASRPGLCWAAKSLQDFCNDTLLSTNLKLQTLGKLGVSLTSAERQGVQRPTAGGGALVCEDAEVQVEEGTLVQQQHRWYL
jgi:hypothetical protein